MQEGYIEELTKYSDELFIFSHNASTYIRIVVLIGWTKASTFNVTDYIYLNRARKRIFI